MKTIIFDIDNTIADQTERERASIVDGKFSWELFENPELVAKDKPIEQVIEIINELWWYYSIIFVTARKEKLRNVTHSWLVKNVYRYSGILYMRPNDDFRPDVEFKEDLYERELKYLDIFAVFDDRPRICRMWQSKGLYVFECNNKKGDW